MTKHSPGPWTPEESGDGKCTAFYADDDRICEPVCVVDHDDITEEGVSVVEANKSLIAAAPELLAACERVLSHSAVPLCDCGEPDCATTQLRAAVAKATGR